MNLSVYFVRFAHYIGQKRIFLSIFRSTRLTKILSIVKKEREIVCYHVLGDQNQSIHTILRHLHSKKKRIICKIEIIFEPKSIATFKWFCGQFRIHSCSGMEYVRSCWRETLFLYTTSFWLVHLFRGLPFQFIFGSIYLVIFFPLDDFPDQILT